MLTRHFSAASSRIAMHKSVIAEAGSAALIGPST
jgi:hypothetical protein